MASKARIPLIKNAPVATVGDDHGAGQPEMRNMAFALFHPKAPMSDDHWKQIGALLQKANEERLKVVSQEPLAGLPESKQPESRNVPWNN
jgi:hypothetical protein